MKRFKDGQRVMVKLDESGEPIGVQGTVARLRRADHGAWIALDERHERCPFPADDAHGRATHIMAYPEDCEPTP